jgi:hypothetical protein
MKHSVKIFSLIFKIIYAFLTWAIFIALVLGAYSFSQSTFKPVIIIAAVLFIIFKLRIRKKSFVLLWDFILWGYLFLRNKFDQAVSYVSDQTEEILEGDDKNYKFEVFVPHSIPKKQISTLDLILNGCLGVSFAVILMSIILAVQNAMIKKEYILVSGQNYANAVTFSKTLPGLIDTSSDPIQIEYTTDKPLIHKVNNKEYYIYPLAKYEIAGMVVAKNSQFILDDRDLGPIDIGLSWGKLALPEYSKYIKFNSAFRLMPSEINYGMPLSGDYIQTHSSHNHIIPSSNNILDRVSGFNIGDKVLMKGFLVEVKDKNDRKLWKSSLVRDDHVFNSSGGCEVFYVTDIITENKI